MAHWKTNSPSSASKAYVQKQKSLLGVQLLDILANSVSKRNPFAGITTSNQLWRAFSPSPISLFFTFVLMWSFISLLHGFYTVLQPWVSLHEQIKASGREDSS